MRLTRSIARRHYDRAVRPRPHRLERLPEQYFTNLLALVAEHAALEGEPLVDTGTRFVCPLINA